MRNKRSLHHQRGSSGLLLPESPHGRPALQMRARRVYKWVYINIISLRHRADIITFFFFFTRLICITYIILVTTRDDERFLEASRLQRYTAVYIMYSLEQYIYAPRIRCVIRTLYRSHWTQAASYIKDTPPSFFCRPVSIITYSFGETPNAYNTWYHRIIRSCILRSTSERDFFFFFVPRFQ